MWGHIHSNLFAVDVQGCIGFILARPTKQISSIPCVKMQMCKFHLR